MAVRAFKNDEEVSRFYFVDGADFFALGCHMEYGLKLLGITPEGGDHFVHFFCEREDGQWVDARGDTLDRVEFLAPFGVLPNDQEVQTLSREILIMASRAARGISDAELLREAVQAEQFGYRLLSDETTGLPF